MERSSIASSCLVNQRSTCSASGSSHVKARAKSRTLKYYSTSSVAYPIRARSTWPLVTRNASHAVHSKLRPHSPEDRKVPAWESAGQTWLQSVLMKHDGGEPRVQATRRSARKWRHEARAEDEARGGVLRGRVDQRAPAAELWNQLLCELPSGQHAESRASIHSVDCQSCRASLYAIAKPSHVVGARNATVESTHRSYIYASVHYYHQETYRRFDAFV